MSEQIWSTNNERLEGEAHFCALADNVPHLMWLAQPDGYVDWYNARWYEYTGSSGAELHGWGWQAVQHPEVLQSVLQQWRNCIATGEPFEMVIPLRSSFGEFRRFLTRANPIRDEAGELVRWFGTNTDIEDQCLAEERLQLLVGELKHRGKNTIAVVQAIAHQTLKSADRHELENFRGRILALARAHDVIADQSGDAATLHELVWQSLAAFGVEEGHRVLVSGPTVRLSARDTVSWTMLLHELATNSVKYGAWSAGAGRVEIEWTLTGRTLSFRWKETGGPPPNASRTSGYGSKLIAMVARELRGTSHFDFPERGLTFELLDVECC